MHEHDEHRRAWRDDRGYSDEYERYEPRRDGGMRSVTVLQRDQYGRILGESHRRGRRRW
jgi:hypothetical protein